MSRCSPEFYCEVRLFYQEGMVGGDSSLKTLLYKSPSANLTSLRPPRNLAMPTPLPCYDHPVTLPLCSALLVTNSTPRALKNLAVWRVLKYRDLGIRDTIQYTPNSARSLLAQFFNTLNVRLPYALTTQSRNEILLVINGDTNP